MQKECLPHLVVSRRGGEKCGGGVNLLSGDRLDCMSSKRVDLCLMFLYVAYRVSGVCSLKMCLFFRYERDLGAHLLQPLYFKDKEPKV